MMIRGGNLLAEARRIPGMAGQAQVTPDFAPVASRIREEATDDWNDQVAVDRFTGKGGQFVRGRARLAGPKRVEIDGREFTARRGVVIATGSRPQIPPVPGLDAVPYWTNREAIAVKDSPRSLMVLGGGAVGVELAQAFARFGTAVTVVEAAERLLPAEEPETSALLADVLGAEGITVRTGAQANRARHDGDTFTLTLEGGEELTAERLLVATGRRAAWPDSGSGRLASTRTPAPCTWTSSCERLPGCGASETSPAAEPSPMSRCTRPRSRSAPSSANPAPARTTAPAPGHLHRPRGRLSGSDRGPGT